MRPLFPLGQVYATPDALHALERAGIAPSVLLARHQTGDFGDLCSEDAAANRRALRAGSRIFSSYPLAGGTETVWIITEADRSSTTLLRPEDY